jgi:peptidoglycan-associated lipoprotein
MKEKLRPLFLPCIVVLGLLLVLGGCAKKTTVPAEETVPAPMEAPAEPEVAPAPVEAPELTDVYFDFDKYNIRADARETLSANYEAAKGMPSAKLLVEGHCDERGTEQYNMALGQRRADATKDYLVSLGMDASLLSTISYGEGKPQCTESNEDCWAKNRRAHFAISE